MAVLSIDYLCAIYAIYVLSMCYLCAVCKVSEDHLPSVYRVSGACRKIIVDFFKVYKDLSGHTARADTPPGSQKVRGQTAASETKRTLRHTVIR